MTGREGWKGGIKKGHGESLGGNRCVCYLDYVALQIIQFKYGQFTAQLSFNKAVKKKKSSGM